MERELPRAVPQADRVVAPGDPHLGKVRVEPLAFRRVGLEAVDLEPGRGQSDPARIAVRLARAAVEDAQTRALGQELERRPGDDRGRRLDGGAAFQPLAQPALGLELGGDRRELIGELSGARALPLELGRSVLELGRSVLELGRDARALLALLPHRCGNLPGEAALPADLSGRFVDPCGELANFLARRLELGRDRHQLLRKLRSPPALVTSVKMV